MLTFCVGFCLLCVWAYQSLDYGKLMSHAFRIYT